MTYEDTDDHYDEDEQAQRRFLARADPAAGRAPLDPARFNALLEDIMSTTDTTPTPPPAQRNDQAPRVQFRQFYIGVAAAAVLIGGGVAVVLSQQQSSAPVASTTALSLPQAGGPAAMCAELTPDYLSRSGTALAGTVETIIDGTVTLTVTERFAGDSTDTVTVPQGADTGVDGEALTFQAGGSYLIAANTSGVISECGGSGPDTPELRSLYTAAFKR